MPDRLKRQRFVFLAVLLTALFSYPLLSLADKPIRVKGIPLTYLYIFVVWIFGILLLYRNAEKRGTKAPQEP